MIAGITLKYITCTQAVLCNQDTVTVIYRNGARPRHPVDIQDMDIENAPVSLVRLIAITIGLTLHMMALCVDIVSG